MAVQISKKRKFVADGIFKAELNEFLTRELAEDGYSGVEVRVTPTRTEIIILATRSPCPTTSALWSPRRRPCPPHQCLSRRGPSQRCPSCPREHLYPLHKRVFSRRTRWKQGPLIFVYKNNKIWKIHLKQ
uniref:RPS3 n=1 Tax=Astatotilapia calliptera TaxID=8154 RepID=A0AAX7TYD9_ASTCA